MLKKTDKKVAVSQNLKKNLVDFFLLKNKTTTTKQQGNIQELQTFCREVSLRTIYYNTKIRFLNGFTYYKSSEN